MRLEWLGRRSGWAQVQPRRYVARSMAPQSFVTSRLTARCWEPADAALALEAIGASLPQLQLWTPWVVPQPFEIATLEGRFRQFHEQFQAGQHFIYGLFDHEQTVNRPKSRAPLPRPFSADISVYPSQPRRSPIANPR